MRCTPIHQPTDGPADKPLLNKPVAVSLDVPVYYTGDHGLAEVKSPITCSEVFALTVLSTMEGLLRPIDKGIAHVGIYNPRKARHKDGTLITPARWSNHAYGSAIDFKGVTEDGRFVPVKKMSPDLLHLIIDHCRSAITTRGLKPEIVDEGDWIHIGIWHGQ